MRRRRFLSAASVAVVSAATRATAAAPALTPAAIGIMGSEIDGTFVTDLTSVLNSDALRVVPIIGKGSVQNIGDLLHLPGVDLVMIASDTLDYARRAHLYPGELGKVAYISKLYDNDLHVCAQPYISSLADLN